MKPLPPKTVLRLAKLWPHARKQGHEIGEIRRVGYYTPEDGLDCIWLVDDLGRYNWTADHMWVRQHFEVVECSDENDMFGGKLPGLGARDSKPLNHAPPGTNRALAGRGRGTLPGRGRWFSEQFAWLICLCLSGGCIGRRPMGSGESSHSIRIRGEVSNPGEYMLPTAASVLDVIEAAGGATAYAPDAVTIARTNGIIFREKLSQIRSGHVTAPGLRSGDVVIVPRD